MNKTNKTIKAKHAVPGQWYLVGNETMLFVRTKGRDAVYVDEDADIRQRRYEELITHLPDCTGWDWKPTPKHPPIPEGWRLIDKEKDGPKRADDKFWNRTSGTWAAVAYDLEFRPTNIYIRRIEPAYRPFASAAEFDPHADRIAVNIGTGTRRRIDHWGDTHVNGMTWDVAFRKYTFLDGTPFGVRIDDEQRKTPQGS